MKIRHILPEAHSVRKSLINSCSVQYKAGILLILAFFLTGCGSGSKDTIRIGVAGAHSGDLASYGLPSVNAVKIVADIWNKNGGIAGKQIELIIEDDVCKPEIAVNTAARLIGRKVIAVIGHICSGATRAALPLYRDSRIVCISPSATNPPLTKSGEFSNFFRTIAPDDAQAKVCALFVLNKLKGSKIAILHDKGDYGKGFAETAKLYFEEDGRAKIVVFDGITAGAVDYSAVINKIAVSGADVVVYGGYHPEASKLVTQMRKKNMIQWFVSDDGVKDDTFIRVAGKYAEGVYATGPVDTSSNPLYQAAAAEHRSRYNEEPGAFFFQAYAAAEALFSAIEKAGSTEYEKIKSALRENYCNTTLGQIRFDALGDASGIDFSMYRVDNGVYIPAE